MCLKNLVVKAQLFVHKNSGAELLSVESTDDNKVFGVTFKHHHHVATVLRIF